jgi:hypothetical protein
MSALPELFADRLWFILAMIALAVTLTALAFHYRWFDEGFEQGEAADPDRIHKDNPPDEWSKSHWV